MKYLIKCLAGIAMLISMPVAMADTYRYLHVTIDTPWIIFIFLMFAVLMPFILMAILYWHNAMRRNAEDDAAEEDARDDG